MAGTRLGRPSNPPTPTPAEPAPVPVARAADPEARSPRSALLLSFVAAVAVRVLHAATTSTVLLPRGDNTFYVAAARSVATGHWGRLPTMDGTLALSVKFPPLWPWTLGAGQRILWFLPTGTANTTTSIAIGATVAPLIGLLTWRVLDRVPAARRRGLAVAVALLAAVHPLLIGAANSLMSEVVVVPVSIAILLVLHRVHQRGGRPGSLVVLGALVGLSALARPEALVMWGAAIAVAAALARSWRILLLPMAVALVLPVAYSAVTTAAAHRSVFVSTNAASAIAGANCPTTWSGEAIGHWSRTCLDEVWLGRIPTARRRVIYANERLQGPGLIPQLGPRLEGEIQDAHQRGAIYAIRRNPAGFARAVPFRVARGLGLWWSPNQTRLEVAEGRIEPWELVGRWMHIVFVLPAAAYAALGLLRRRGRVAALLARCVDPGALVPMAVAVGVWVLGLVATHGSTRHRAAVDAVFLLAAAVGYAMVLAGRAPSSADGSDADGSAAGNEVDPSAQPPVVVVDDSPSQVA